MSRMSRRLPKLATKINFKVKSKKNRHFWTKNYCKSARGERTLKIELPDDLYEMLQKFAEKSGQTPEQFAQEWLSHALEISKTDPLESFIGAFNTAFVY